MNWNSTEFIWLDWLVLTVGVIAIVWAVYRANSNFASASY